MSEFDITATIVLYKNNEEQLKKTIESFLNTELRVRLYLVDNSPTDHLRNISSDERTEYIFMNSNKGFGAGHNIILRDHPKMGKYHLVLNPDIIFSKGILESLFTFMENHPDVGNVMPKIVYPNGDLQYLCKLLPTPRDWIIRMFLPFRAIKNKINYNFEMHFSDYNKQMNVPYLSGCFMFLRRNVIEEIGVFDEKIFMYGEDTDLNRRIYKKYKTIYNPDVQIVHNFEKGSHKNFRLMWIHIKAAFYYLNKWGWFFDADRRKINKETKARYTIKK